MKKIFFVFLFIGLNKMSLYAQKGKIYELNEVTKQELLEKKHHLDTSASAAYLYKKGKVTFEYHRERGFESVHEITYRIKIYKKEGLDYGIHKINSYINRKGLYNDRVTIEKAVTYNIVDDKIEKINVKKEGINEDNVGEYVKTTSVVFSNVKVGSIIELKYKVVSDYIHSLRDFDFQDFIPTNYAVFITEIPTNYVYKSVLRGFFKPELYNDVFHGGHEFYNGQFKNASIDFLINSKTFILKDLPKIEKEPFVDNYQNYKSKIENELEKILIQNQDAKQIAETWDDVTKSIYKDKKFGNELLKRNYFEDDLLRIVSDSMSNEVKMKTIQNFVKNRIQWNGYRGIFTKEGVVEAYTKRSGNIAEINMVLITMLNRAGFNANPVLLSTRDNGTAEFPNIDAFNYLIAHVEDNGKTYLLDASDKYGTLNILPSLCLNGTGRLVQQTGGSSEVLLNPDFISKEITFLQVDLNSDLSYKGKYRSQKDNYLAYDFRRKNGHLKIDEMQDKLESEFYLLQIANYDLSNKFDYAKPIIENYTFEYKENETTSANKILINPLFFLVNREAVFTKDKRNLPIDFIFPINKKITVSINLPEEFEIESIPSEKKMVLLNNDALYSYKVTIDKNKVLLQINFDLKTYFYTPDEYAEIQNFFIEIFNKEKEHIFLKRKS
ncbi:MAG: hypothetical protein ACOVQR_05005 [Flavobacterium sp.]|jgi:hypothetical protein|uniref:hypothetical protein n=1 Tax=Flavobacterium sp. TaxID=239 RepID=UPI003BA83576